MTDSDISPVPVSQFVDDRSGKPDETQANIIPKTNKKETTIARGDPLCSDNSEILEWLQEFRENLVDDEIPLQGGSHASSSHEASLEPIAKRREDLGKHSVYTHFPKDRSQSEIYSKRLNAKEVIFPKEKGEFTFPIADGRIKTPGEDQELRTSSLVRPRPSRGEGHVDFLGESEGSFPQPHDSLPVAGEAINDFWSMSGSFKYRHHVEPRVKLYSPREESFPIPLKYNEFGCQAREA